MQGRIGVNTGEVVTGTEERLATGDAVNVAARLEQAAAAGEILIGEATLDLVRGAVEVEAGRAARAEGQDRAGARRSGSSRSARRRSAPRVALRRPRARARAAPRGVGARARTEQRCELVTVVGDAGVGKSRLVAEALAVDRRAGRRAAAASPTARGSPTGRSSRCSSSSTRSRPIRPRRRRSARCSARPSRHVRGGDRLGVPQAARGAGAARRRLRRHPVGRGDVPRPRRGRGPALAGAPLLLVCLARPELLERRPHGRSTLRLEPLPADAVDELIGDECPRSCATRIAAAAGGNPLFVTEMLAMAAATASRRASRRRCARCSPPGSTSSTPPERRGARARRRRGRDLPPRRRPGARPGASRRSRRASPRSSAVS